MKPTPPGSPVAAFVAAAREYARRKLGNARLPVAVSVELDESLQVTRITVELTGGPAPEGDGHMSDCLLDIIVVLVRAGRRLTTTEVLSALDAAGLSWGEGTVKAALAAAVKDELLDNKPDAKPPGYGLPGQPGFK